MWTRPWARQLHGRPVAAVGGPADERRGRHADVVEVHVCRPGPLLPHLPVAGAHGQARAVPRHQEDADVVAGGPAVAGPGEDHEQVRDGRVGDVPLVPSEQPVLAVAAGAGAQPGGVRAGLGLGQREAGDDLAGGDAREPLGLLLGGAAVHEDVARDPVVGAEQGAQRRRGPAELEDEPALLLDRQAEPAELLRDGEAVQAHLPGLLLHELRHLVGRVDLLLERDDLRAHEGPHGLQDVLELRRVHVGPCSRS